MGVYIKGVTKSQLMKVIINSTEFMPDDFEVIEVNCSEKPNNCTDCECTDDCSECKEAEHGCKDEPTISKMEQVDKDTNVRSKAVYDKWGNVFDARADIEDEPQHDYEPVEPLFEWSDYIKDIEDEPQTERSR